MGPTSTQLPLLLLAPMSATAKPTTGTRMAAVRTPPVTSGDAGQELRPGDVGRVVVGVVGGGAASLATGPGTGRRAPARPPSPWLQPTRPPRRRPAARIPAPGDSTRRRGQFNEAGGGRTSFSEGRPEAVLAQRRSTSARTSSLIAIGSGQGRTTPSPGHLRVASKPTLDAVGEVGRGVVERVDRALDDQHVAAGVNVGEGLERHRREVLDVHVVVHHHHAAAQRQQPEPQIALMSFLAWPG